MLNCSRICSGFNKKKRRKNPLLKKESKLFLNNSRFTHMKLWLPRLCENLTEKNTKNNIIEACTKFQIGCIPGHRTQFHLFVVKSLIAARRMEGEGCILYVVDIRQLFVKLNLVDAMYTLKKKVKKVVSSMVQTKREHINQGQDWCRHVCPRAGMACNWSGGRGAALVSSLSLDQGVDT